MLNKLSIRLVKWLLGRDLDLDQRNVLVVHILDNLGALPIHGIISTSDEGEILLNGSSLDIEKLLLLRESARTALDNPALKIVNHEVEYIAVVNGVHKAQTPYDLIFYKAALWYGQQQKLQLSILAQRTQEPSL